MNYTALSTPEKVERLHNLHSLYRNTKQRLTRLRAKIAVATEENGIEVDEELLHQIMTESAATVAQSCQEDSFQCIFWDEQIKAASVRDGRGMRWHPHLIKWCLHLHHLSSGAYEMLRSSGCLKLHIPANLAGLLPQHYCWVLRPGRPGVGTSGCHHYLYRGSEVHSANP